MVFFKFCLLFKILNNFRYHDNYCYGGNIMDFEKSETLKNLTRAFASECQDGAKYQYIADEAETAKQNYISTILKQLATNEMAHAKILYDYICSKKSDGFECVEIRATYPMQGGEWIDMLEIEQENETKQANTVYPAFSKTAKKEGFEDISVKLMEIAKIESCHTDVLSQLYQMLKNNSLNSFEKPTKLKCVNCGHEETVKKAWKKCPLCNKNGGYIKINLCGCSEDCDC